MNQKGYVHLEIEKDDKLFYFAMPMGASLAEAADAALLVFKECDKMYREAIDRQLKSKEEEPKAAE